MSESFVTLTQFPTEVEAQMLVLRLQDAGIQAHIANNYIHGVRGTMGVASYVWVQVAPEDFSQAQEVASRKLPDLEITEVTALEDAADALAVCPACGAEAPEYIEEQGNIVGTCSTCGHHWTLSDS